MTLAARVGRAIFWGQAGRVAEAAAFFYFSLILARRLGPASYGAYAVGVGFAAACCFLAFLGLGPETLGRFLPHTAEDTGALPHLLRQLIVVRAGAIAVIVTVVLALRVPIVRHGLFPAALPSLALVLLLFAARSFMDLFTYFSCGLLQLHRVALAKLLAALAPPLIFLAFAAAHPAGVRSAWMAAIAGTLVGLVVLAVPFRNDETGKPATEPQVEERLPLWPLLRFGLFAWASNLFVYVLGDNADVLLLGWLLRDGAPIGIYAVGAKIAFSLTTLLFGWSTLTSVAAFSEAWQQGGEGRLARVIEAQWKLTALCLVGPLLLATRYARAIVTIFYAPVYLPAVPVLQILAGLMSCAVLAGLTLPTSALYAMSHERLACGLVALAASVNVISEIILVRHFGILGAAFATGGSFLLLAVLSAMASRSYVPWRYPSAFIAKVAMCAGLSFLPTVWLHAESLRELALGSLVWVMCFLAGLLITRPLDESDPAALARVHPGLLRLAHIFSRRPSTSAPAGGMPCQE